MTVIDKKYEAEVECKIEEEKEKAYRRGFFQGYCACSETVEANWSLAKIKNHLYKKLSLWRGKRSRGKFKFLNPNWGARHEICKMCKGKSFDSDMKCSHCLGSGCQNWKLGE